MPKYRVRPGQKLPHHGRVLVGGDPVELPRRMAMEIRHLVDEVDAKGLVVLAPPPAWREALDGVRDHERVSVLAEQRAIALTRVETAQLLAEEAVAAAKSAGAEHQAAKDVVAEIDQAIDALTREETSAAAPKATTKKDKE